MQHPNADILRAIADGKQVQWSTQKDMWNDNDKTAASIYLVNGDPDFKWRVKPEKKKGWINIYPNGANLGLRVYLTKEEADHYSTSKRIACIEIEYEEGQGL